MPSTTRTITNPTTTTSRCADDLRGRAVDDQQAGLAPRDDTSIVPGLVTREPEIVDRLGREDQIVDPHAIAKSKEERFDLVVRHRDENAKAVHFTTFTDRCFGVGRRAFSEQLQRFRPRSGFLIHKHSAN
jgi:hypothetical protein